MDNKNSKKKLKSGKNPVWIERPDDMTRIVYLQFPHTLGAEGDKAGIVDKLTVNRPKVKDILETSRMGANEDERRVQAVARMTRQLPSLIEELYTSDWERVNDAYDELRFPERLGVISEGLSPGQQED